MKFKRAIIIHGWDGAPENNWFPWAKKTLSEKGITVEIPAMPNPSHPEIQPWVSTLSQTVGKPTDEVLLIGHSMGCQTILRYLETLRADQQVGGVVLVAGFLHLTGLQTAEEFAIAQPWIATPIDLEKVQMKAKSFTAIFSDDDPFVPVAENRREFETKLGAKSIVLHKHGHINAEAGMVDFPLLLEVIVEMEKQA